MFAYEGASIRSGVDLKIVIPSGYFSDMKAGEKDISVIIVEELFNLSVYLSLLAMRKFLIEPFKGGLYIEPHGSRLYAGV